MSSVYKTFAEQIDNMARSEFAAYERAADKLKAAQDARSKFTRAANRGLSDAEFQIKASNLELACKQADLQLFEAKRRLENSYADVQKLRGEMRSEVEKHFFASPAQLDKNTVTLLNSGIRFKPGELRNLFDKSNDTTKRYVGQYCKKMYDDKNNNRADNETLASIIHDVTILENPDSTAEMKIFDGVCEVYRRTSKNPSMAGFWGSLTEESLTELSEM